MTCIQSQESLEGPSDKLIVLPVLEHRMQQLLQTHFIHVKPLQDLGSAFVRKPFVIRGAPSPAGLWGFGQKQRPL